MWRVRTISGSAGGVTGEAHVTMAVRTMGDTVEEVRARVQSLPLLEESLRHIDQLVKDNRWDLLAKYLQAPKGSFQEAVAVPEEAH